MNLKKTPFAVPLFMVKKSGFMARLDASKYPKLYKRVCDLANKEKMSGNATLEKLMQEEFEKIENHLSSTGKVT